MKSLLRWVLCLYIVLLGSEEYFRGPGPVYKIAIGLVLAFSLALLIGEIRIRLSSVGVWMIALAVLAFASLLWSVDTEVTSRYAFVLIQLMITTWIMASCIESESDMRLVAWCLFLAGVLPSLGMVRDYLTGGSMSSGLVEHRVKDIGERMTFGDADPNLIAYRIVVSILAGIHLNLTTRNILVKALLYGLVLLFIAGCLLTGSRGGAVALVISSMILLLTNTKQKKGSVLLTVVGITAVLLLALPKLPDSVSSRFLGISKEVASGRMAKRKDIYHEAGESFNRQPILGVGYLAFEAESRRRGGLGLAAHNDTLQILLDLGLVGLAIYAVLIGTMLHGLFAAPSPWKGFGLSLLAAYGVSSMSITLLAAKLPWISFGIIIGASGLSKLASGHQLPIWNRWLEKGPIHHG